MKQSLAISLQRLEALYKKTNLKEFVGNQFVDQMYSLLEVHITRIELETPTVLSILSLFKLHLVWQLYSLSHPSSTATTNNTSATSATSDKNKNKSSQKGKAKKSQPEKEKEKDQTEKDEIEKGKDDKEEEKNKKETLKMKENENSENTEKGEKESEGKGEKESEGKGEKESEGKGEKESEEKGEKELFEKKREEEMERREEIKDLIENRDRFVKRLMEILDYSDQFIVRAKVFETINDLLIYFSVKKEKRFALKLSNEMSENLLNYIKGVTKLEGEEESVGKILLTLCKSILAGVFPVNFVPLALSNYNKHGKDCSNMLKIFLSQMRDNFEAVKNLSGEYFIILETLKHQFQLYFFFFFCTFYIFFFHFFF